MHRLPAILAVILVLPLGLFAAEMVPYVAASVAPTITFTHPLISGHPEKAQLGEPFTGFGSQFELGVVRGRFDYYFGYARMVPYELDGGSQSYYDEVTSSYDHSQLQWRDERWILGARFRLFGNPGSRVQPIVGLAATSGRITAAKRTSSSVHYHDYPDSVNYHEFTSTERSDSDFGLRGEFGFTIQLPWSFDVLAVSRFQYIDTGFHGGVDFDTFRPPQTFDYAFEPSVQVGLRYVIHQIKLR